MKIYMIAENCYVNQMNEDEEQQAKDIGDYEGVILHRLGAWLDEANANTKCDELNTEEDDKLKELGEFDEGEDPRYWVQEIEVKDDHIRNV